MNDSSSRTRLHKTEQGNIPPLFFDDELETVFLEEGVVFGVRRYDHAGGASGVRPRDGVT